MADYSYRPTSKFPIDLPLGTEWHLNSGYLVTFQTDGNFVVYNKAKEAVWASDTADQEATMLSMQGDGNLVIYAGRLPIWSTKTHEHPGAFLAIQQDGNVVVYDEDTPVWATGTNSK